MAQTVGPIVDEILLRLRDPHAIANSRALIRRFLYHAEGLTGAMFKLNTETISFTSEPRRIFYVLPDISTRIVDVQSVRAYGKDLDWTPFNSFVSFGRNWFRQHGPRFATWSKIGRDLLVVWPANEERVSVDIIATTFTSALAVDGTSTTLQDEHLPMIKDLCELFLLLRMRRLDGVPPLLERIKKARAPAT